MFHDLALTALLWASLGHDFRLQDLTSSFGRVMWAYYFEILYFVAIFLRDTSLFWTVWFIRCFIIVEGNFSAFRPVLFFSFSPWTFLKAQKCLVDGRFWSPCSEEVLSCESLTGMVVIDVEPVKTHFHPLLFHVLNLLCDKIFLKTLTNLFPGHRWMIFADFSFPFWWICYFMSCLKKSQFIVDIDNLYIILFWCCTLQLFVGNPVYNTEPCI